MDAISEQHTLRIYVFACGSISLWQSISSISDYNSFSDITKSNCYQQKDNDSDFFKKNETEQYFSHVIDYQNIWKNIRCDLDVFESQFFLVWKTNEKIWYTVHTYAKSVIHTNKSWWRPIMLSRARWILIIYLQLFKIIVYCHNQTDLLYQRRPSCMHNRIAAYAEIILPIKLLKTIGRCDCVYLYKHILWLDATTCCIQYSVPRADWHEWNHLRYPALQKRWCMSFFKIKAPPEICFVGGFDSFIYIAFKSEQGSCWKPETLSVRVFHIFTITNKLEGFCFFTFTKNWRLNQDERTSYYIRLCCTTLVLKWDEATKFIHAWFWGSC